MMLLEKDGIVMRLSEKHIQQYLNLGYKPVVEKEIEEVSASIDKMTLAELKEYARNNKIDITGLTKKADIFQKIKEGG